MLTLEDLELWIKYNTWDPSKVKELILKIKSLEAQLEREQTSVNELSLGYQSLADKHRMLILKIKSLEKALVALTKSLEVKE